MSGEISKDKDVSFVKIEDAFDLIEEAVCVVVGTRELCYPGLRDLSEDMDKENVFLDLDTDSFGSLQFAEGDNESVPISAYSMTLVDTKGEKYSISLLDIHRLIG